MEGVPILDFKNARAKTISISTIAVSSYGKALRTVAPLDKEGGSTKHPAVQTALRYMEAHFAENVSIRKLAELVSLRPCHFARLFGRHTTVPPHVYLEHIRIRKAQEFLDRGHTLASGAIAAGFVDQSHLTHRFKRFLGIHPVSTSANEKFYWDKNKIFGGTRSVTALVIKRVRGLAVDPAHRFGLYLS